MPLAHQRYAYAIDQSELLVCHWSIRVWCWPIRATPMLLTQHDSSYAIVQSEFPCVIWPITAQLLCHWPIRVTPVPSTNQSYSYSVSLSHQSYSYYWPIRVTPIIDQSELLLCPWPIRVLGCHDQWYTLLWRRRFERSRRILRCDMMLDFRFTAVL